MNSYKTKMDTYLASRKTIGMTFVAELAKAEVSYDVAYRSGRTNKICDSAHDIFKVALQVASQKRADALTALGSVPVELAELAGDSHDSHKIDPYGIDQQPTPPLQE